MKTVLFARGKELVKSLDEAHVRGFLIDFNQKLWYTNEYNILKEQVNEYNNF